VVLTDRRGLRFELTNTEEVVNFRRHGGHFEGAELDFLAARPLSGTVIDVGANVGAFTAVLARAVGASGTVHAFEPLPAARARLVRTLDLNGLDNVRIHDAAVSDRLGAAALASYGADYASWSSLTRTTIELPTETMTPVEYVEVTTTTLDAFCAENAIDDVALLKIDVEGAEGRVISGAAGLLGDRRIRLLLLELSDNTLETDGWSSRRIVELLHEAGYDTWTIEDGALAPFRAAGRIDFANLVATPRAGA
jgi:FkbM family methyltransferase